MTVQFYYQSDVGHDLLWNYPNIHGTSATYSGEWNLEFISQHSNLPIDINIIQLVITGNDRFSKSTFLTVPPTAPKEHLNGIYVARLYSDRLGESYEQVVKIITSPGGNTGTTPYISNNEDRQAIVYYKPEY